MPEAPVTESALDRARREALSQVDLLLSARRSNTGRRLVTSLKETIARLEAAARTDALFRLLYRTAVDMGCQPTKDIIVSEAQDIIDRTLHEREAAAREEGEELTRQEERALTVVALENAIRNPGGTFQMPLEAVMVAHREALAAARLAGRLGQMEHLRGIIFAIDQPPELVKEWDAEIARLRKEAGREL